MAILHRAQDGLCCHCEGKMADPDLARLERGGGPPGPDDPTIEHVTPRGRGGRNAVTNLLLAHCRCNAARGVRPLSYRAHRMHERVRAWLFVHVQADGSILEDASS